MLYKHNCNNCKHLYSDKHCDYYICQGPHAATFVIRLSSEPDDCLITTVRTMEDIVRVLYMEKFDQLTALQIMQVLKSIDSNINWEYGGWL